MSSSEQSSNHLQSQLKSRVAKYVQYDNYINKIQDQLKPLNSEKNKIKKEILYLLKSNNIPKLKIDLPDGHIRLVSDERPQAINIKYITHAITQYFMMDANSNNMHERQAEAERLIKYILDNRETKQKHILTREYV
jgi:hypothetical protein